MIKVGIIDDEVLARKVLEDYCSKIDNFQIVLSTGNPLEFINFKWVSRTQYNLEVRETHLNLSISPRRMI